MCAYVCVCVWAFRNIALLYILVLDRLSKKCSANVCVCVFIHLTLLLFAHVCKMLVKIYCLDKNQKKNWQTQTQYEIIFISLIRVCAFIFIRKYTVNIIQKEFYIFINGLLPWNGTIANSPKQAEKQWMYMNEEKLTNEP